MATQQWNGRVESNQEAGVNTGLNFRQGATVTIVSSGWARYSDDRELYGPSGSFGTRRTNAPSPEEPIGALLVKTGRVFTPVGGGLLNWAPPTDDNVEFLFNDVPGKYGDNVAGFDVTMQYDDDELI